jgi:hypothetical protein
MGKKQVEEGWLVGRVELNLKFALFFSSQHRAPTSHSPSPNHTMSNAQFKGEFAVIAITCLNLSNLSGDKGMVLKNSGAHLLLIARKRRIVPARER